MPSSNTNIFKIYIKQYEEILEYYNEHSIRNMEEYLEKCNDILRLDEYNDSINSEVKNIDRFSSELPLVLNASRPLCDEKYKSMLSTVSEIRSQYSSQISLMEPYITQWHADMG